MIDNYIDNYDALPPFEPIRPSRQNKRRKRGARLLGRQRCNGHFKTPSPRGGRKTHEIRPSNLRSRLFIPRNPECRSDEVEQFRSVLGDRLRHALHIAHKKQVRKLLSGRTLKFARTSEQEMLARAASVWLDRAVADSSRLLMYKGGIRRRLNELLVEFGGVALDCPAPFERAESCKEDQLWHFHAGNAVFVCGAAEPVSIFQRAFSDAFLQATPGDGRERSNNSGTIFYIRTGNIRMQERGKKLGRDSKAAERVGAITCGDTR